MREQGSDEIRDLASEDPEGVACRLTYVEARAALVRMLAARRLRAADHPTRVADLDGLWRTMAVVLLDEDVLDRAVDIVDRHGLRAYDAVQLAAALRVSASHPLRFACFDRELRDAAGAEHLPVVPAEL